MSSQNYFDLLADDENDEPTAVIARATLPSSGERPVSKKSQLSPATAVPTGILSKPPPQPPETAKELKSSDAGRGGRANPRGGRVNRGAFGDRERDGLSRDIRDGFSRDRGSFADRNTGNNRENIDVTHGMRVGGYGTGDGGFGGGHGVGHTSDKASRGNGDNWSLDGNRGRGRSGGRGRDRISGEGDERPRRREFDRRSGSGFGLEVKRDGSGRGNWGAEADQSSHQEAVEGTPKEVDKVAAEVDEKITGIDELTQGVAPVADGVEKEEEDNELTLDEYEKILEEKRKALSASKAEERKVLADKAFESMLLVEKRNDEDVFIKVGSEKEKKKKEKEALEKEEKARKTQSINEFLKPTEGEKFYGSPGGRGRGRSRGRSGEGRGGEGERMGGIGARVNFGTGLSNARRASAPRIEDPGQFPTLGAK